MKDKQSSDSAQNGGRSGTPGPMTLSPRDSSASGTSPATSNPSGTVQSHNRGKQG